ncbi:hypothetical protein FDN13_05250 [Caloramator sp. E03]|uniref:hypothetical protein n=1 Tax=Caloramator sp. E03 TaxID=2576307 RepID=UPI0011109975|nr:hypothetical protein [Caloramator sp. E03]QCX33153.1 hypothetical protein FDN13_05250 [Caloramator sp. E03]
MEELLKQLIVEVKGMNTRLDKIESRLDRMETDIKVLKEDQQLMKSQLNENTSILKALEHKADINKAEHDNFTIQLARIEGSVNEIKSEVVKGQEAYNFVQGIKNILVK